MKPSTFHFELFNNTPFLDRWKKYGYKRCVWGVVLICWLPLLILAGFQGPETIYNDATIYIRFLVSLPVILFTPLFIRDKLHNLVLNFTINNIIKPNDREKFFGYVESTLRLRDSRLAVLIIWIIVYSIIISYVFSIVPGLQHSWRTMVVEGKTVMSLAGWWFSLVSQPIYNFVLFYFLYRAILWWRFIFLVSRMDLQLRAAHGDDTGGLLFIGESIRLFYFPAFAISSSVAAGAANLVLYENLTMDELKLIVAIIAVILVLIFIGPLLLFYSSLLKTKEKAILEYGRLNSFQLADFEKKWIHQLTPDAKKLLLESSDFSNVTDAISIVNKAKMMRTVPFTSKSLTLFILLVTLPFLPVFALKLPWQMILQQLVKFVA